MEVSVKRSNRELWLALVAMIFITGIYLLIMRQTGEIPGASDLFGHSLGILGFVLMLMTEILYSLRKRSRSARWGKMSSWLQFHIFTGLVGPFMVLLHTSWKFNGLAGIVLLLTVIIVLSGVVGRYIFTAIPRTADGAEIESAELERLIAQIEGEIDAWKDSHPEAVGAIFPELEKGSVTATSASAAFWGRTFTEWQDQLQWWFHQRRLSAQLRRQTRNLEKLLRQRRVLQRQIASLALARRLLSLWHTVHIPIGLALFITAFIHIVAAFYYATLLR
jgi:hypothetical protein